MAPVEGLAATTRRAGCLGLSAGPHHPFEHADGRSWLRQVVVVTEFPEGNARLDDWLHFAVNPLPGSGVGPRVNRERLRYWGAHSAPAYRALLGLAYLWFEPGQDPDACPRREEGALDPNQRPEPVRTPVGCRGGRALLSGGRCQRTQIPEAARASVGGAGTARGGGRLPYRGQADPPRRLGCSNRTPRAGGKPVASGVTGRFVGGNRSSCWG